MADSKRTAIQVDIATRDAARRLGLEIGPEVGRVVTLGSLLAACIRIGDRHRPELIRELTKGGDQ